MDQWLFLSLCRGGIISCQNMPSGWQHPHTQTHRQHPQDPSLVRHEAEVTLTRLTPKPLAVRLVTALRSLSFGQGKRTFPLALAHGTSWRAHRTSASSLTQCSVPFPSPCCPSVPLSPASGHDRAGMAVQLACSGRRTWQEAGVPHPPEQIGGDEAGLINDPGAGLMADASWED